MSLGSLGVGESLALLRKEVVPYRFSDEAAYAARVCRWHAATSRSGAVNFFATPSLASESEGDFRMPTEMHTICFHTRDAVERHDSTFTFDVPKDGLRTGAAKVALASCEFPMVQMTVEKGWDRLYLNEGCRLTPSNNLLEMDYGYGSILLPPRLNEVESVSSRANDSSATLRFAHPHGLWGGAAATRPPLANLFRDVTPTRQL